MATTKQKEIAKLERLENKALYEGTMPTFRAACHQAREVGYVPGRKGFASHVDWLLTASRQGVLVLG
jgi:hypothetical protein